MVFLCNANTQTTNSSESGYLSLRNESGHPNDNDGQVVSNGLNLNQFPSNRVHIIPTLGASKQAGQFSAITGSLFWKENFSLYYSCSKNWLIT